MVHGSRFSCWTVVCLLALLVIYTARADDPKYGTVKWYSSEKGFGFISIDDEDDMFVHFTQIVMPDVGFPHLEEGQSVRIEDDKVYPE
jgi:CspA family cold shock protein